MAYSNKITTTCPTYATECKENGQNFQLKSCEQTSDRSKNKFQKKKKLIDLEVCMHWGDNL